MTVTIICGGQYGDEGKGKIVSYLAQNTEVQAFARAGTGPNAGHTVVVDGTTYKLQLVPSGFFNEESICYIGAGMLINPKIFLKEVEVTGLEGRVFVDSHTGIIEESHIERDKGSKHLREVVGSTGTGCGPANEDRAKRVLKLAREIPELSKFICNVSDELNTIIENGENVIIEGSQATFLSLIHGTYPFVTSKDVTASTFAADVGIGPTKIDEVIVVFKAYVTRVGTGPLVGELKPEEIEDRGWQEYGTVTGRLRRAAPFDFELARKAVRLNGATSIALTKIDILYPELSGKQDHSSIPEDALEFIEKIENSCGVRVKFLSTGPNAKDMIIR